METARMFRYGGIIILIWIVFALWWFVRNGILLDGDFLGMKTRAEFQKDAAAAVSYRNMGKSVFQMFQENGTLPRLFANFVARYGSATIDAPLVIYIFYAILFAAGGMGICVWLPQRVKKLKSGKCKDEAGFFLQCMLSAGCLITFGLWLYYCYCMDYQAQGRYLMPIVIPFMWHVTEGIDSLAV